VKKIFFLFVSIAFIAGCGKKQKDVFYFPPEHKVLNINKLELGYAKNVKVLKTEAGNEILWQFAEIKNEKEFLGYNVYKLVRASFVPNKPLNKSPIKQTRFLDEEVFQRNRLKKRKKCFCYLVRAVFKIDDKIYEGPSSQVACDYKKIK